MAFTNEKIEDLFIKLKELNCSSINNDLEAFQKLGEIYSAGDLLKKIWRELDYLYTKPIKPSKPDECKFKFGLGPAGPILKFFISGMFDWTGGMVESIGIFLLCLGLLVISIELISIVYAIVGVIVGVIVGFTGEYFQSAIIGWITCCIIELLVRFFSDSDDYNYYKKELAEYKNKLSEYRETVLEINRVKSDCKKILEEKIDQLKPYFANYPEIDLYDYSEKSTSAKMVKIVSVLAKYGKIDNMDSAMTAYNKIETIGCSYSDLDMIFEGFNKLTIDEALEMYKYIKSKHVSIEDAMSYIKPDITDNIDEAIELYEVDCSADLYRKMCKFKLASSVPEALNVCKIIKYNNSAPVKKVLDYIVDGKCRATSLSEALNFYAEDCHRRHMEEIAKENLESQLRLEQAEKDREERYRQIQEEAYMKANDHRREEEKREARDRGRSQCFSCQNLGPCRFSDDNYGNCGAFRPKI